MKSLIAAAIAIAGCSSAPAEAPATNTNTADPRTSQQLVESNQFLDQLQAQPPAARGAFMSTHQKEASALAIGIPEVQKRLQTLLAEK